MKREDINRLLAAYLDEEVTPEERKQIEAHLPGCEKCQEELRMLSSTREGLRQALGAKAAEVEPPTQAWDGIRQRIILKSPFWEQFSTILTKPVWRAAIPVVLVLIVIGALWGTGVLPGFRSGMAPPPSPNFAPAITVPATTPAPTTAVPRPTPPPPVITIPPQPTPTPTPSPDGHVVTSTKVDVKPGDNAIIVSGLMIKLSLDDLVRKSDVIVIGKVAEIMPSKQSYSVPPGRSIIYTDVIIHTERYLYGKPQSNSIAVQVRGGRIGNMVMVVEDMPVFNLGEDVALFLQRLPQENTPPSGIESADYYTVYGSAQGKHTYSNGTTTDMEGNPFSVSQIEQKIASLRP